MDIKSKCFPPVSNEDKHNIAKLALGEDTRPVRFQELFFGVSQSKHDKTKPNDNYIPSNIPNRERNNNYVTFFTQCW